MAGLSECVRYRCIRVLLGITGRGRDHIRGKIAIIALLRVIITLDCLEHQWRIEFEYVTVSHIRFEQTFPSREYLPRC